MIPNRRPNTSASVSKPSLRSHGSYQATDDNKRLARPSKAITSSALTVSSTTSKFDPRQRQAELDASPIINITPSEGTQDAGLADELDYITVAAFTEEDEKLLARPSIEPSDKASRILGIRHRRSMEPIPANPRASLISTRSARSAHELRGDVLPPMSKPHTPSLPLTSLYVVSGLPKSPHTWTLADPDSIAGLNHTDGAVNRWWRPEVLGSTVSPGAGGGKKKKKGKGEEILKGAGALSKQEVGRMLSKALKLSFTREVEVIASTLQPASTIHTFNFTLPAPNTPLAPTPSGDLLRASMLSASVTDHRISGASYPYPYANDPFARPSTAYLGPASLLGHGQGPNSTATAAAAAAASKESVSSNITYHGVCLTVWSHADAERSNAIRRTLEAGRSRKESAQSLVQARLRQLRGESGPDTDPGTQAKRVAKKHARHPWGGTGQTDVETDGETEGEGVSESDFEVASTIGHGPGESTLFLPGDTVFWLPYALTLVSRHPVYDLMRDYLTLSWARFSKDVQSHTLQIQKILAHPAPRAGDLIKLDASAAKTEGGDGSLEVIARFPGGLDFGGGMGLVDINFTMWPLFKCLNIDNILTICEIALAPTGRVLFFSRHPAMLGIAVMTIKYLVELRGWNGIALSAVHSRDAKIYVDDPGPWIMGLATEVRYSIRPSPEICVCDLDINYLSCPSPPINVVSTKKQRDGFRQRLLSAFDPHYHPDHSVPSEFKEAFPAGRFRPICKIQAKRGASSAAIADSIKPPEWWNSTRIIQAFDIVLQDKLKKPSFFKRISSFGHVKSPPQLTAAEMLIQHSIRKRATAFVDARDDLETKIGRLSRRLNFLMTESDLWRDKFVTFESYAEKLSAEANQLRAKINKEQKESKRLSSVIMMTAEEKKKLESKLYETEHAHKDAVAELQKMREAMDQMEEERAQMVAEVEAQIESAIASMTVGIIDQDDDASQYSDHSPTRPDSRLSENDSRPQSRVSSHSTKSRGRSKSRQTRLRSFATDSTLVETYNDGIAHSGNVDRQTDTIEEADEDAANLSPRKKRFSNSEIAQDAMAAVDEGISKKSEGIAMKVLEIQQKLNAALQTDARTAEWKEKVTAAQAESETEKSDHVPVRPHPPKGTKLVNKVPAKKRARSSTTSSTHSRASTTKNRTGSPALHHRSHVIKSEGDASSKRSSLDTTRGVLIRSRRNSDAASSASDSPPTPTQMGPNTPTHTPGLTSATTDDESDFQSAYSTSPPRQSFVNLSDSDEMRVKNNLATSDYYTKPRERISSTATAAARIRRLSNQNRF